MSTKIVIVDDHGIVREGLRLLLGEQGDMEVVAEACDGRQAVEIARKLAPQLVIMDVSMPNLNGIEATRQIVAENPGVKVLALSAYSDKRFVTDMFKAGASGYVLKDALSDELVRAIHGVLEDGWYVSPKIAGIVIKDFVHSVEGGGSCASLDVLTPKERELLQLLAENKTSKEAARLLHVSVKTIDARRRSIANKLGVSGIADLTKFAIREGLTSLDF